MGGNRPVFEEGSEHRKTKSVCRVFDGVVVMCLHWTGLVYIKAHTEAHKYKFTDH